MKKEIILSAKFMEELRSITEYILQNSQSQEPALKFYDGIVESVKKLADFPEMGVIPRNRAIRLKGYRVLILDNYLVFYRVEEKVVIVYHIVNAKQKYSNLI